jgi:hypothetical protein
MKKILPCKQCEGYENCVGLLKDGDQVILEELAIECPKLEKHFCRACIHENTLLIPKVCSISRGEWNRRYREFVFHFESSLK